MIVWSTLYTGAAKFTDLPFAAQEYEDTGRNPRETTSNQLSRIRRKSRLESIGILWLPTGAGLT